MQSIIVRYHGPRVRGARFVATATGGKRITVPYDHITQHDKHAALAAAQLAEKLGWTGRWHGGAIKDGWIFVVEDPDSTFEVGAPPTPTLRELRADGKVIWGDTKPPHDQIYSWRGRHYRVDAKTLKIDEL